MRLTVTPITALALACAASILAAPADNSSDIGVGDFGCLNNCMAEVSGTACGGLDNNMGPCVCNTTAFRAPMAECYKKNCRPAAGPYFEHGCEAGGVYAPELPEDAAQSTGVSIAGVALALAALAALA